MPGTRKITYSLGFGLAMLAAGPLAAVQQIPLPPNSTTGLTVTPAYEGWYENPDGTYSLSFGYFNRNTDEIIEIPLGPDNMVEPAGLAQNQPTRFEEGRHWGTFVVRVPGDFGDREVAWTLRVRGRTFTVPGHLRPDWNIDALGGGAGDNEPPALRFERGGPEVSGPGGSGFVYGPLQASVGEPVEISLYADDAGVGPSIGGFGGFGGGANRTLATLTWFKHQGPGDVTFAEASHRVRDAEVAAVNSVTFGAPGEYVIRIRATDSAVPTSGHAQCCWSNGFVAVSVNP